jgi:hypothetical protein
MRIAGSESLSGQRPASADVGPDRQGGGGAPLSHRDRYRSPPRARLYELRATMARPMLSEVYGWFTKASTPPANRSTMLRPIKQLYDDRYTIWRSPVSDAF